MATLQDARSKIGSSDVIWLTSSFPMIVPVQHLRCVGWNSLMLVVFFVFLAVTPSALHTGLYWNVFLVLVVLNLVLSFRTVYTDPGYIPAVYRDEVDDGSGLQKSNPLVDLVDPSYRLNSFDLNYCRTCRHLRPKFSTHCKMCDACVSHFDHHCVVLGCCIGGRNVGSFISYLSTVSISAAYGSFMLVRSWVHFEDSSSIALTNPRLYAYIAMFFFGFGTAIIVGMFAVYYAYLVISGKSSKQFLTKSQQEGSFGVTLLLKSLFFPDTSVLVAEREQMM